MGYKKELVSKLKSLIRLKEENIYNDEIEFSLCLLINCVIS